MRPHENLIVWQKAIDCVVDVYKYSEQFPRDERFGLTSQLRRAAVSIPANIAEGAGRDSAKEFAYFLSVAQGSASELKTEILIAFRLGYLSADSYSSLCDSIDHLGRMLVGLSRRVRHGNSSKP